MSPSANDSSPSEYSGKPETLYYCEKHGVMNKTIDLVERVDQIARRK
jgi:hypothetical protein